METFRQYISKRWRYLLEHKSMQNDPFGTILRACCWIVLCMFRKTVIAKLNLWDVVLYLPAKFRRSGGTMLYIAREYYEPEFRMLGYLLKPGDVFVDGGANLGAYTIVGSRLVGNDGVILAFEPAKENIEFLIKNIELNNQQNVKLFPIALSNVIGEASLHHIDNAPTSYSLGGDVKTSTEYEVVKTTTLDSVIEKENIKKVDVIKLDVEGAEEIVLRGAMSVLEKFKPITIFEIRKQAAKRMNVEQYGALNILKNLGYSFFGVGLDSNKLILMGSNPPDGNYIALHDPDDIKRLTA